MKIHLFCLLLLLSLVSTQTTYQDIQQIIINSHISPSVNLILIYDSQSSSSTTLVNALEQIGKKRQGYFKVNTIDCNTDDEQVISQFVYCNDQYRSQLPALLFTKPALNMKDEDGKMNQAEQVPYQGGLDEKSLFNFAAPLMPIFSEELRTVKDLKKFEEKYEKAVKIYYYTDKEKISPFYRALTANFRNTIAFAHVFSTSPLAKGRKIQKYPLMELNGEQKIQIQSSLTSMIQKLKQIQGEATSIVISEYVADSKTSSVTEENLEELVYQQSEYILIHVMGDDGEEHPEWKNVQKKFRKMFKYYQTSELKDSLGVKVTPAIVYFPKSLAKKKVQKTIFFKRDTVESIQEEIDSMIDDFTVALSSEKELQQMTGLPLRQGKFVAVLFHEKQISLTYKILSNNDQFKEDIAFFRMRNPEPSVMQQFQIKKLPFLTIMMMDDTNEGKQLTEEEKEQGKEGMSLKLATYTGKYNYDELSSYLRHFVKKQAEPESHQSETEIENVREMKKAGKFKAKCLQETCYLLLINGGKENQAKNKQYIQQLEKESKKIYQENFAYLDGICHSQIRGAFEIMEDELPALVYINSKFQKYTRLVGRLESRSINNLFSKVRSNKAMYRGYDKLQFQNKDCQFEHDRLQKLQQQNIELSDEEAQILNEIKAEEEKKREEYEKAAKEDKVRKKKKRRRPKAEEDDL